jgi:hypothetical protein
MSAARVLIPVIAVLMGGWLVFDGTRAFVAGDYLRAQRGPRAGQLGPWASLLSKAGIDPRAVLVKSAHVSLGVLWLAGLLMFLFQPVYGRWMLAGTAVGSLWYLPIGTLLSAIELILLFLSSIRRLP